MTSSHSSCRAIEPELVAAATGDADADAARRVQDHVARCAGCREDFHQYQALDTAVGDLRVAAPVDATVMGARRGLESRLADLRQRLVRFRIFPSPLGNILIARSEHGVSLVEYLGAARTLAASRLVRTSDVEPVEDGTEIEALYRDLLDYVEGRRTTLDWPLDFRLARGDFDRLVLRATAAIPYGAVTSYARIATVIGKPTAARAVAQALRWNPLPLVVPCHRIIGSSGALVGYAGDKIPLKQRLLSGEGVRTIKTAHDVMIARDAMYALAGGESEYCVPTCPGLSSVTLATLTLFSSRERAEHMGLRPCTTCRPDLNPIH
jgi:O-6-methylguanine DNA methyltransferase